MADDLLSGLRTLPELMAEHFCYHDALADLVELVDNDCSPECLFAAPETLCECRCRGAHHGQVRADIEAASSRDVAEDGAAEMLREALEASFTE